MKMIHPEIETLADVVDANVFNAVWAPRGWELLDGPETLASEILSKTVKRVSDLKVEELKALVAARGLEYPPASAKKAEVLAIFLETFGEPAVPPVGDTEALAPKAPDADTTNSSAPADNADKDK